jgi:hypothetical protein
MILSGFRFKNIHDHSLSLNIYAFFFTVCNIKLILEPESYLYQWTYNFLFIFLAVVSKTRKFTSYLYKPGFGYEMGFDTKDPACNNVCMFKRYVSCFNIALYYAIIKYVCS